MAITAFVLVLICAGGAQQKATAPLSQGATEKESKPTQQISEPRKPETAASQEQPGSNAIKIQGAWVIEVRNPDGSLVSRHEFENDITPVGKASLTALLTRTATPDRWDIRIISSGSKLCTQQGTSSLGNTYCDMSEPVPGYGNTPGMFYSLSLSLSAGGDKLILSGSATVDGTASIAKVETALLYCPPENAPGACPHFASGQTGFGGGDFTMASPSPAISVQAGQTVNVTVTLGFS